MIQQKEMIERLVLLLRDDDEGGLSLILPGPSAAQLHLSLGELRTDPRRCPHGLLPRRQHLLHSLSTGLLVPLQPILPYPLLLVL